MQSGSELENDGTRAVIRSEMSDERILYGDFHAVGRAIEAVFRQRAMFSDFGEILRFRSFYIKVFYFLLRKKPTRHKTPKPIPGRLFLKEAVKATAKRIRLISGIIKAPE